jgi:Tol biopolymer transport system component
MRRLLLLLLLVAVAAGATARAQPDPVYQIFSARLDGGDARSLSSADATGAVRGPGRRVFFVARGGDGRGAFWVMNEDGSDPRQLGAKPGGEGSYGPAWSPDGRTVGITRSDESPCTPTSGWGCAVSVLVLVDAETGAERLVLRSRDHGAGWLSWAPDGSRLAFASELNGDRAARAIETIRPDGSARRVLVRLPAGAPGIHDVAWSPRGDRIAYDRGGRLYVVRPQGGASTRLVRGHAPVWSPKGRRLLFQRQDDTIRIVDVATRRTRVLGRAAEVGGPTWSPDGRRVAFLFRPRNTGLWSIAVVRVSDGRRLHTWYPGRDVSSLFFTRDGARLVYGRLAS